MHFFRSFFLRLFYFRLAGVCRLTLFQLSLGPSRHFITFIFPRHPGRLLWTFNVAGFYCVTLSAVEISSIRN